MPDEMPSSWRYLNSASSRISTVKSYIKRNSVENESTGGQSWREWAGQKMRLRRADGYVDVEELAGMEKITLFPGWATRRYGGGGVSANDGFGIEVFVSGFVTLHRSSEQSSRSQRAFIRLAKGFASLPNLSADAIDLQREFQRAHDSVTEDPNLTTQTATDLLRRHHANLERRLQPFWSSVLPLRTIRLHLFAHPFPSFSSDPDNPANTPIDTLDVVSAADGSFQALFRVKWEELCVHPGALHIAFADETEESEVFVCAELVPSPCLPVSNPPRFRPPAPQTQRISLTHSPIRVISDIDDTIKLSNILHGARAVFHSVFVKDLHETIIPGMGEWYTAMWSRGVRFHYVSNGPFEILPVINEFLQISQLPPGSIKLKSYAGRSLFTSLLSAPAARKRTGVTDVLDAFPRSRFILVGDSGEQDLELYAELARERPHQILAVFIRDADTSFDPIDDPTGWNAIGARSADADSGSNVSTSLRTSFMIPSLSASASPSTSTSMAKATVLDGLLCPPDMTIPHGGIEYFAPTRYTDEPESISPASPGVSMEYRDEPTIPSARGSGSGSGSGSARGSGSMPPPGRVPPMSPYAYTSSPRPHPHTRPTSLTSRSSRSSLASRLSSLSLPVPSLSAAEKKRSVLQGRVYRARTQMPSHVFLRVFRHPGECVGECEKVGVGAGVGGE